MDQPAGGILWAHVGQPPSLEISSTAHMQGAALRAAMAMYLPPPPPIWEGRAVMDFLENCYDAYGVYNCPELPCICPYPCYEATFCSCGGIGWMQPSDWDFLDGYSEEGVKA